jgi:3-phenylpropionate/cinnamic acid dioxygenase small subunit
MTSDTVTTDHEAIATLIAKHACYADEGDADRRAALYAHESEFTGPDGVTTQGVDAIHAMFASRQPVRGKHVTTNVIIDIDGDEATSRTDFVFLLSRDEGFTIAAVGHYEDRFVRTEQGWRFARRRIVPQRPA